jgi:hypothetical protein
MLLKGTFCVAILTGAVYSQSPQSPSPLAAPVGLHVATATKSAVALTWIAVPGATGYQVERRVEPGAYASAGTESEETAATDSKIDPYTTYTYRVKAVVQKAGAPQVASPASNEVKVGPPPTGFNIAVPTPKDADNALSQA